VRVVTVVNVYKPPNSNWSSNTLKVFPHPTIYVGDFNSHNQLCGYEHNNADEKFRSARWRKDYSPDLSIRTQDPKGDDITNTRHNSNGFSKSQHRPLSLHYGLRIPLTRSVPKHRLRLKWLRQRLGPLYQVHSS
jgi:hypothetical protein